MKTLICTTALLLLSGCGTITGILTDILPPY